ncbi:CHAT domain-containing protein [Streptomyces tagetis]|uniref:CHAT domain-containing protein n=1 Tax=Streptomyces tagetis TaxID=2820809 RepID=A0A940XN84_9ACTN|nr:CHAT domain-containing protein [Streptomyces sp. RG38]MBQ0829386.1 CHAT domain-containing protein [Streptomyces sp. RG38]
MTEAVELFACTTRTRDIVETCHLVGMLHWQRGLSLADARALPEVRTATALLVVVSLLRPDLPLPDPVPRPPGAPLRPDGEATWEDLLQVLAMHLGGGADAHTARLTIQAARNAAADTAEDPALLVGRLRTLGMAWQRLYEHTGELADIQQAVVIARRLTRESAVGSADRTMSLHNLAESLRALFGRTGEVRHLREAVDIGRAAVREVPQTDDKRYLPLGGLADSLRMLYERTDDATVLDEALQLSASALEALPESDRDRPAALLNSAILLRYHFERTGNRSVLYEAIAMSRGAAKAAPRGTPIEQTSLHNLGSLLHVLSERNGDMAALDEAIEAASAAVDASPAGHPDGARYRSALVGMLNHRFNQVGDAHDLDRAIALGSEAVAATPKDHPNRWMYVANLAVVLKARTHRTKDLGSLRHAIVFEREMTDLASEGGGRHRAAALTNLGNSLRLYFAHSGDMPSLEEAISAGRAAVDGTAEDHPFRAQCEVNLALSLSIHGVTAEDGRHVQEALGLLETAASRNSAPTTVRLASAREWGELAMATGRPEQAARGFALGVELLPRLAARGLPRSDATRWMAEYSRLASDAAACALAAGEPDRAVEVLEMGRGVLLAQALESRTDLTELRERAPALAERFDHLCARLDDSATDGPDLIAGGEEDPDLRRRLAHELDALVARIRTLAGLEGFLLPPRADRLAAEAHGGPIVMVNVSRYRCDALALTTEGIRVCELPDVDHNDVRDRLGEMRNLLARSGSSRDARLQAERGFVEDVLPWLWDTVTEPVLDLLLPTRPLGESGTRRLWWIPCGPLAHFPLHAAGHHLETPPEGGTRRTVMDRVVSSYAPTVRALSHARAQHARRRTPSGESGPPRLLAVAMPHTPDARDLPGALTEYRHLARLLPTVEGLVGEGATRQAVLSSLATHPWAHFACHAGADPDDPYRSHLLVHDHAVNPLNVLEISRLRLETCEFAYLSACDTAVTGGDLADESLHVVTAFQLAGFPQVVGTLWQINDTIAVEIAERVYAQLAADGFDSTRTGASVHAAIQLIRDRYPRFPTLWAAHVHMGP